MRNFVMSKQPNAVKPPAPAPAAPPAAPASPISRTSAGLRDLLFDEIEQFRQGKGDPDRANAIAKLASHIVSAAKLEYDYQRDEGDKRPAPKPLQLGNGK